MHPQNRFQGDAPKRDYKANYTRTQGQGTLAHYARASQFQGNFINQVNRQQTSQILSNIVETHDVVNGQQSARAATLHSRVAPELELRIVWPANVNSLVEGFLECLKKANFDLAQFVLMIDEFMKKEAATTGSLCRVNMYFHMIHTIMLQTGTPNRLGQSSELLYFTRDSICFKDALGKYNPERMTPNKIFRADSFIVIQLLKLKHLAECEEKANILRTGKHPDDILVTWKTRSLDEGFKSFSYFAKTRDFQQANNDALQLFQQLQHAGVTSYRRLINYVEGRPLTDEHLPPRGYQEVVLKYSDQFQANLDKIKSENNMRDMDIPNPAIKGVMYFIDPINHPIDFKVTGQRIIELYKELDPNALKYVSETTLRYIKQVDYNYMQRAVQQFRDGESDFNKSYMNLALNQKILEQQLQFQIQRTTQRMVGDFQALQLSVAFMSDYDKPDDEFAQVQYFHNRMAREMGGIPMMRNQSSVTSMLPSRRTLGVMDSQMLEPETQNSQYAKFRVLSNYNFQLLDTDSLYNQIERINYDINEEEEQAQDKKQAELNKAFTASNKVVDKARDLTKDFQQGLIQAIVSNLHAKVETDNQKFIVLYTDVYDILKDKHVDVPMEKVKPFQNLLAAYGVAQECCKKHINNLNLKQNPLRHLLTLNHQIAEFLTKECELTEIFQGAAGEHFDVIGDINVSEDFGEDIESIFSLNLNSQQKRQRREILENDQNSRMLMTNSMIDRQVAAFNELQAINQEAEQQQSVLTSQMPPASSENAQDISQLSISIRSSALERVQDSIVQRQNQQ